MRSRWLGLQQGRRRGGVECFNTLNADSSPAGHPQLSTARLFHHVSQHNQPAAAHHCQRKCVLVRSTKCSQATMARTSSRRAVPPNSVASYVL